MLPICSRFFKRRFNQSVTIAVAHSPAGHPHGVYMLESLTYSDLAERLGVSPEAARAFARRKRWPRVVGNDGRARIQADLGEISRPPGVHRVPELLAQIETLREELARSERTAAGHRADFERERDRGDRLAADLGKLAEIMASRRPWWRRLAG
jgi:hypothetical protein